MTVHVTGAGATVGLGTGFGTTSFFCCKTSLTGGCETCCRGGTTGGFGAEIVGTTSGSKAGGSFSPVKSNCYKGLDKSARMSRWSIIGKIAVSAVIKCQMNKEQVSPCCPDKH